MLTTIFPISSHARYQDAIMTIIKLQLSTDGDNGNTDSTWHDDSLSIGDNNGVDGNKDSI